MLERQYIQQTDALQVDHAAPWSRQRIVWRQMLDRCYNKSRLDYCNYGARGITVCERWRLSYEAFVIDMGLHPGKGYSIDRIDVNGNYEPGNCRWATSLEQRLNQRTAEGKKPRIDYAVRSPVRGRGRPRKYFTLEEALEAHRLQKRASDARAKAKRRAAEESAR